MLTSLDMIDSPLTGAQGVGVGGGWGVALIGLQLPIQYTHTHSHFTSAITARLD